MKFLRAALSLAMIVLVFFVLKKTIVVRLYPVCVSAVFLCAFGFSLLPIGRRVPFVFRLACLQDKSILSSPNKEKVRRYCRNVTAAWCVFFVANGLVALWSALCASDRVWSVYNGIVAYILMGVMFAVEYTIRRQVNKKMPQIHTISGFNASSWDAERVMCFDGTYTEGKVKKWRDFLIDTAKLRKAIEAEGQIEKWVLHCDDYWYFCCAFIALLQCHKIAALTQNTTPQFLSEVRGEGSGFITDIEGMKDALYVPDYLSRTAIPNEKDIMTTPAINADETQILMFTSGSTGHAKAVPQRMTEFEADNAFIISKWGEEFTKRALVSTVSAHHIYGFLFTISLPFALGVPFRRKRVEYPEELERLTDKPYIMIAVPAFLKRTVESEDGLQMSSPFIFTSGGAVPFEVAEKTEKIIGSWPLEVYGSTETSGIAWRLSKYGMEWTPFDNAKVWKGEDGCLIIVSPYIKNPNGFATSDLVEMLDDGRFRLLGRSDSIVKIEEKRISLTEVEERLLQTGLVSDAKVIAMEDRRQYLAAVVVLNEAGRKKAEGKRRLEMNKCLHDALMSSLENVVIPKRWRYVDAIPCDIQGKRHKEDIAALFNDRDDGAESEGAKGGEKQENLHGIEGETVKEKGEGVVELEFTIPGNSDFFDGHFPEFHLLPAVAQFEIVTRFAKKYLNTQRYVPRIRRIKFSAPILPDTRVGLKLEYDKVKGSITYSLWDANTKDVYSSGAFSALRQGEK